MGYYGSSNAEGTESPNSSVGVEGRYVNVACGAVWSRPRVLKSSLPVKHPICALHTHKQQHCTVKRKPLDGMDIVRPSLPTTHLIRHVARAPGDDITESKGASFNAPFLCLSSDSQPDRQILGF